MAFDVNGQTNLIFMLLCNLLCSYVLLVYLIHRLFWFSMFHLFQIAVLSYLKILNVLTFIAYLRARGLWCWSAAARLLGLPDRIPPGAWSSFACECCGLSKVSVSGWSPVQRIPTECGVSECDRKASVMRRPRSNAGCCTVGKKYLFTVHVLYISFCCGATNQTGSKSLSLGF
jgi:hypothetical protein